MLGRYLSLSSVTPRARFIYTAPLSGCSHGYYTCNACMPTPQLPKSGLGQSDIRLYMTLSEMGEEKEEDLSQRQDTLPLVPEGVWGLSQHFFYCYIMLQAGWIINYRSIFVLNSKGWDVKMVLSSLKDIPAMSEHSRKGVKHKNVWVILFC